MMDARGRGITTVHLTPDMTYWGHGQGAHKRKGAKRRAGKTIAGGSRGGQTASFSLCYTDFSTAVSRVSGSRILWASQNECTSTSTPGWKQKNSREPEM
ncbi:hypothetical protein Y1Q_0007921 [Alligator mississippiensis]|uniref:Uncharacterized protein n=1 Tax=Alligator mississippiensis TaxID=8496 RepID=A0A151NEX4_ALLMI|nr:hypothetical protein Y1Q_0007921 [Alligator mississippiensis]